MAGRDSKLLHHPHKHQDSILVQIAQKPLLVAALFLLTALLPWVLSLLAPLVVQAFQEKTLLDLARWLSAPFLFALVNFAIFFLWINSSSPAAARRSEGEIVAKADIDGIIPLHGFVAHDEPLLVAAEAEPSSAGRPSLAVRQPPSEVEATEIIDKPPQRKLAHKRSRSLTLDPATLKLAADITAPSPRPPSSRPKSKTPGARRVSNGEPNKFDPSIVDAVEKSRNVARRNSSPKPAATEDEPAGKQHQQHQQHQMRTAQSSNSFVYTPPVREPVHEPAREPIPLEKDDLNARIESFLTRFKMQRQESNLKALLS